MKPAAIASLAVASSMSIAVGQPAGDTAKYQPTILSLRACIRANAPPAYIAGIRAYDEALRYLHDRCYQKFTAGLAALGAGDAAAGSFRLVVRDEWIAFLVHIDSH
jgi:hypothetical protein